MRQGKAMYTIGQELVFVGYNGDNHIRRILVERVQVVGGMALVTGKCLIRSTPEKAVYRSYRLPI
jgi:hypothetical protein